MRGAAVGVGGQPSARFWANAFVLIAVLFGFAGTSSSALAGGPKPDPPPIKHAPPPPPPVYQPPPPAYVPPPPAPPPVTYQAPPSGPTAAQILAAQRAAARAKAAKRAKARLKKQRLLQLRIQRQQREAKLAAERRTDIARLRAAASLLTRRTLASSAEAPARGSDKDLPVVPILALTTLGALFILGLGLVPSTAVPRSRMSAVLEEHHGHFTLVGGMVLLGAAIFLTLTLLAK